MDRRRKGFDIEPTHAVVGKGLDRHGQDVTYESTETEVHSAQLTVIEHTRGFSDELDRDDARLLLAVLGLDQAPKAVTDASVLEADLQ
jgi:hypothetical protein